MKNYYFKINLLPYRDEVKKQRKQQFILLAAAVVVAGGALVLTVNGGIAAKLDTQNSRNKFLKERTESVKKEIDEIKNLKEQLAAMLARKTVVENLQLNRADAVLVMEELQKRLPEGMYLKMMRQTGEKIVITGYTQSNGKVATFARNLEDSPYLQGSEIVEVKSVANPTNAKAPNVNEFTLNVLMERQKIVDDKSLPNKNESAKGDGK